eukprot:COSAG01_NODE_46226_length_402_cov_0.488449_1_plen_91_part_10
MRELRRDENDKSQQKADLLLKGLHVTKTTMLDLGFTHSKDPTETTKDPPYVTASGGNQSRSGHWMRAAAYNNNNNNNNHHRPEVHPQAALE